MQITVRIPNTIGTRNGPKMVARWKRRAVQIGSDRSLKMVFLSGVHNTISAMM